jgi:hypothetical protein
LRSPSLFLSPLPSLLTFPALVKLHSSPRPHSPSCSLSRAFGQTSALL